MSTGLSVRGLGKSFGTQAILREVSFTLPNGQTLAVLGTSGCGKSTLLKVMAGLETADRGDIRLDGASLSGRPPGRRQTVYLYQEPLLFPHLDVAGNIGFGLRLKHLPEAEIRRRVDTLIDELELTGLAGRHPDALSGGQRQRVAFGRALAIQPRLLLLDEPFSSLDAQTRDTMQGLFRRLASEHGITALFVTHDVGEALKVGNRHALLHDGCLNVYPTRAAFCADPRSGVPAMRAFWGTQISEPEELSCQSRSR